MKLVIDVMGFDNRPIEAIKACRNFSKINPDVQFILVGDKNEIEACFDRQNEFEILATTQVIKMEDEPIQAVRKTDSSMYKAINHVAKNNADGVLSAGSTGSFVFLTYMLIKTLPNITRPAFMPYLPTIDKKGMVMLDVGANKECSGEDLYKFAVMADIYSKLIRGIKSPRIGIVNIGTENNKGFPYHDEANRLIRDDKKLNSVGFVETRNLLLGEIDIAVTDGYTGNITLKTLEGTLKALQGVLKKEYKKPWNIPGALLSMGVIKGVKKTFDYKKHAGAIVLGLNKPAVKTHGSADEQQFFSAIGVLYNLVKNDVIEKIKTGI